MKQRIVGEEIGMNHPRRQRCRPVPGQFGKLAFDERVKIGRDPGQTIPALRGKIAPACDRQAVRPADLEIAYCQMELGQEPPDRSEEHTSELQSLMRISYAVFCLKKKTDSYTQIDIIHTNLLIHLQHNTSQQQQQQ